MYKQAVTAVCLELAVLLAATSAAQQAFSGNAKADRPRHCKPGNVGGKQSLGLA
jgi:hypothetical protein